MWILWLISAKDSSRNTTDSIMSTKCVLFKISILVLEPGITPLHPHLLHALWKLSCTYIPAQPAISVEAAAKIHLPILVCRFTAHCENTRYSAVEHGRTCDCVKVIFIW